MTTPMTQSVAARGFVLADTGATPAVGNKILISSITRVGTTATAKAYSHGLTSGSYTLAGCDDAGYNGAKTITVTDADTFTFTVAGTEVTPDPGVDKCIVDVGFSALGMNLNGIQVEKPPSGTTLQIYKKLHPAGSWVQEGSDITNASATTIVLWNPPMPMVQVKRSGGTGNWKAYGF